MYWARELHDRFGQQTASLSLLFKRLEAFVASAEGHAQFGRISLQVENLNDEFRRILSDLHEPSACSLDLHAALDALVGRWRETAGIDAHYTACGSPEPVPEDIRETVVRVVQEALTNILKHARTASGVAVTLIFAERCLNLIVEDDGPGFVMDDDVFAPPLRSNPHYGLSGMHERVRRVGGTLHIETAPGRGVTIHGRLPLVALRP